jgi:molybdopterin synthase catalytic subunit
MGIYAHITTDKIDVNDAIGKVKADGHGAMDIFIGTVRDNHAGNRVTGITYDAHEGLAEKAFLSICGEAEKIWPGTHYAVIHYKGVLAVGEASIVIVVSAPHRHESFDACRYVIDEVKRQAPIWKQEHYPDGKSAWLPGHSLCDNAPEKDISGNA